MALIVLLTGSLIGLFAGIVSLLAGAGILTALALWIGGGILASAMVSLLALVPRAQPQTVRA